MTHGAIATAAATAPEVAPAALLAASAPLAAEAAARLRRRAIFDCCKWDPQVGDADVLARFALLLTPGEWERLAALAAALADETLAAEAELVRRPELHERLGLPRAVRAALRRAARDGASAGVARLMRFDFHPTVDGWRISEVNSDVPGGLNEASGLGELMAAELPGTRPIGDPAGAFAAALAHELPRGAAIGLIHATAWSDDRQMMSYLARRLAPLGIDACFASPAQLVWRDGRATLQQADSTARSLARVARFFPAEWLPALPRRCGWQRFFGGGATPLANPATALLTQSKRFPLTWDALPCALPTWRALLPATHDPREVAWRGAAEWILKPALGRVGEAVAVPGLYDAKGAAELDRAVRRHPEDWVAQRRFRATPLPVAGETWYPCVGVYTVDRRAVGAYGRVARRPLIDQHAADTAVLTVAATAATATAAATTARNGEAER